MATTFANLQPKGSTVAVSSEAPLPMTSKHSFPAKYLKLLPRSKTLRGILDKGAGTLEPLKVIIELVDCVVNPEEILSGKEEYRALKEELEMTFEMLIQYDNDRAAAPAITAAVQRLCEDIKEELQSVEDKANQGGLGRFRKESDDLNEVLRCYGRIRDRLQRVSLNVNISMWKIVNITATNNLLDRLRPAMSSCYNSAQRIELKRGPCTEGTRTNVLSQINRWVDSSDPGSVYWMSGMAGTGKTTISYSLCKQLEASGRLAASFFCSRQLPECRDVNRIIPSIAYQLARFSHPFRFALSDILEESPDAHTRDLDVQFDALISRPLLRVETQLANSHSVKDTLPPNLVILIDALDECENKQSTSGILGLLLTKFTNLPIKFIVSSRPESEIRDQMAKQDNQFRSRMILHELDRQLVQADIKTYLRSALAQMKLSKEEMAVLVERAGVLFIHAATLVRYIGHDNFCGNSRARLNNVLSASASAGKQHKDIDELYTAVLQGAVDNPDLEDEEKEDIRQVLHTVICAKEPLTVDALSSLLKMKDANRVRAALRSLWSVVHVSGADELVTTLHASFPDYMLDPSRSKEYHCNSRFHHQTLALRCFDCFRNMRPQFNICELESSFITDAEDIGLKGRVGRVITTELFYAARHWVAHLQSADGSRELIQELEEFLSVRLLLWMEVMNLKKCTNAMSEVIRLAERCDLNYSDPLRELIRDACLFTRVFATSSVSKSTPHIYTSMLPFWPTSNPIARLYTSRTRGSITINGIAISQRQNSLPEIRRFGGELHFPILSPDGTQLAAGVDSNTRIQTISFSPDGTQIVSNSEDGSIRVWNAESGDVVVTIPKKVFARVEWPTSEGGYKEECPDILRVGFFPDGTRILVNTSHGPFVLDAKSGCLRNLYVDQIPPIDFPYLMVAAGFITLAISLIGLPLEWNPVFDSSAASPRLNHVCILLAKVFGLAINGLKLDLGSRAPVNAFCALIFQASLILVTGVRILGDSIFGTVDIHSPHISCADISFDGTRVISGSADGIIRVHDARTGQLTFVISLPFINEGSLHLIDVAFSSDCLRIISTSRGRRPQIHCSRSGKLLTDLNDNEWKDVIGFSPDATLGVVRYPYAISLINLDTRQRSMLRVIRRESSIRGVFTFTADGSSIACVPDDNFIWMWSTQTGDILFKPIESNIPEVVSMVYSRDGRYIATGSKDGTICITVIKPKPEIIMDESLMGLDLEFELDEDEWSVLNLRADREDRRGWLVDNQSRLLVWVPPELHPILMCPRTRCITSRRGWLKLDFKDAYLGEEWAKCYKPEYIG